MDIEAGAISRYAYRDIRSLGNGRAAFGKGYGLGLYLEIGFGYGFGPQMRFFGAGLGS